MKGTVVVPLSEACHVCDCNVESTCVSQCQTAPSAKAMAALRTAAQSSHFRRVRNGVQSWCQSSIVADMEGF
jgi:hypothetical protein